MSTQAHLTGGRTYEFGLGDRLRIARELSDHKEQRRFAEVTGISRSSINNYESGATKPRRPQLVAWAMATGFSLEWLETGHVTQGGGGDQLPRQDSNQEPAGFLGTSQPKTRHLHSVREAA